MSKLLLPNECEPRGIGRYVFWAFIVGLVLAWLTMSVEVHFRTTEAEASTYWDRMQDRQARALESIADTLKKIERKER